MTQHSRISDDTVDALVELLFCALPSMDGKELGVLLSLILRIVESEARRASAGERQRCFTQSQN